MIAATIVFLLARFGGVPPGTPSFPATAWRVLLTVAVFLVGFAPA